jgi:phage shock protein E
MNQILYKKVLPVVAGALLGYAYYYYIGCVSGTCAITSNPYISTAYGGVIGLLLSFPSKRKKKEKSNDDIEKN